MKARTIDMPTAGAIFLSAACLFDVNFETEEGGFGI
jgi:hypothetical protein